MEIIHEGGVRFTAHCRNHRITIDQPVEAGGTDAGPTPPELLAASMGGCVGYYVARFLEQAGLSDKEIRIDCDWTVSEDAPRRIDGIRLHLKIPGLPENRLAAVQRVAGRCLIHQTLKHEPEVSLQVDTAI